MRESLFKVIITSFFSVLVHFLSFGQNYIIHEEEEWIEIADADDLRRIGSGNYPFTGKYLQTQDIDLTGFSENGGWIRIGDDSPARYFNGVFNGNGFIIKNLTINRNAFSQGLFGFVGANGVLKEIRLTNVSIQVGSSNYAGALVARNSGHVINCAAINGILHASGYSGGLVGRNESTGTIEQSYSGINVIGTGQMGGLIGANVGGEIINSYSQGRVIGEIDIGGLVGRNNSSIFNSYSSGQVNYEKNGGGLLGVNTGKVEHSYWNIETSNQLNSLGGEEGKSDLEMKQKSTFVDWDFEDVWQIREGESMPFLKSLGEFKVNKEIPELSVSLNGLPINNDDSINCTYGDILNLLVESTSDGHLSDLRLEVSDSSIIDISNFPIIRIIKAGMTRLKIYQPETENYDSIDIHFEISAGKKELLIIPQDGQQKVYGEEEPQKLKFTFEYLEKNDDPSLLLGELKRVEGENVGDYAIQLNNISAGDNYSVSLDTNRVYFKIIPRNIFIKIDAKEKVYGDKEPEFTFQLLGDNLIEGDVFEGNLQREEGEDSGLYSISRGTLDAGSNYLLTFEDGDFVIKRALSEITAKSNQVHTYDGSSKSVVANLNHRETELSYSPDSSFVEAGSYDVKIHSPETANYLEVHKDVTLVIHKAIQEGVSLEDSDHVYNGKARSLLVSGLTAEMEKDVDISYENNGHSDAGVYEVTARVKRPNYEDLILRANLTIHKAQAEITSEPIQVHVYDGIPKSVMASLNHGETELSYSLDLSFINAGSYDIQIHSPETANYLGVNKEVTLIIKKAIQEEVYFEDGEYVYDGEERYLLVSGLTAEMEKDVDISYENNGHIDAGIYEVTARVKHPNYEDLILRANLTIHKAQAEITAEPIQVHVYDEIPKSVMSSLNHGETELSYSPDSSFVEAGFYDVKIHSPETDNYLEVHKDVTLVIHKAIQEGIYFEDSDYIYNGEERSLSLSGLTAEMEKDVDISYENNCHNDAGVYEVTAKIKRPNYENLILRATLKIHKAESEIIAEPVQVHVYDGSAKTIVASLNHEETELNYFPESSFIEAGEYQIRIYSPETANYLETNKEVTLTIQKAVQEGIYFEDGESIYNGEQRYLSVSGLTPEMEKDAEISYENNEHTDAGVYEIAARVKRPNYEDLTLHATLTIHKAKSEIIAEPNQIHVYDGTPKIVIASLNHKESELVYESIKSFTNAGIYEVEVHSKESVNFLNGSKKIVLTIEKAILTIIVGNITREFGEDNPEFTVSYKGFKNGEDEEVLIAPPIVKAIATITTDIGEYPLIPSDALADNYDFEYIDGLLTIIPTNFGSIGLESKTFIYDGQEHSLKASNLPNDVIVIYENNNHINAGNYEVKATFSKPGYFSQVLEATLTIKKASQTILFEEVGKVSRNEPYVELNAKSSVGLPIQLFADDNLVASLDGHTLLIHRLGTIRVTASQEGDENHEPAKPITILVQVEDQKQGPVRVHQALSPNGDGINDFLILEGIKEFPENRVQIINPLGVLVFDIEGYDNEINVFKGISNREVSGSNLPDGTYFYVLRYKNDSKWISQKGWIYLKTK